MGLNIEPEMRDYLLKAITYEIQNQMDCIGEHDEESATDAEVILNNDIICMIRVLRQVDPDFKVQTVKEYFAYHYYTKRDYRKFERIRKAESACYIGTQFCEIQFISVMQATNYLLERLFVWLKQYIAKVITDSEEDPQYSAVTLNNRIICYYHAVSAVQPNCPIRSVREFFKVAGYSVAAYNLFEVSRNKESAYYIGKQFTES